MRLYLYFVLKNIDFISQKAVFCGINQSTNRFEL